MVNETIRWQTGDRNGGVYYRPFRAEDTPGVLSCLREEYGESYPRPRYYRESYYMEAVLSGEMRIFIADDSGAAIGFLITRRSGIFPGQTELSTMVIRKKYRGLGLSVPFLTYAAEQLGRDEGSVLFGHTQMFHAISQNNLYELGLLPCGLLLSVLLSRPLHHSFSGGRGQKLALGVMVKSAGGRRAGDLFVPVELGACAALLYNGLGIGHQLRHEGAAAAAGKMRVIADFGQHTKLVVIDAFSPAVQEALAAGMEGWKAVSLHTVNVLLNCSDPSAVAGYRALSAAGFFFTGFQPACATGEYLLLHHPMSVPPVFEDLVVSDPFAGIVPYIRQKYLESWESHE